MFIKSMSELKNRTKEISIELWGSWQRPVQFMNLKMQSKKKMTNLIFFPPFYVCQVDNTFKYRVYLVALTIPPDMIVRAGLQIFTAYVLFFPQFHYKLFSGWEDKTQFLIYYSIMAVWL